MWYNFEGNDTNRVLDLSNRYTDGNLYGGQRVAGKFSQSLQLLPSESIQISGDDFSFNQTFTVSMWTKVLDDSQGIILQNSQMRIEYRDNLKFYGSIYSGNDWQEIGSDFIQGQWIHLGLTLDSSQLKIYKR